MKPILFDGSATNFNTNGIGVLSDCISCLVTEVRNGMYEVEFTYPITGIRYEAITAGRIVLVSHDERKDLQPFVIYRISKPISGIVTVNAHHISYQLNNVIVAPYSETSISLALNGLRTNALTANPFTFWTDKANSGTFDVAVPTSARTLLGGSEGSILDTFGGGEYEFDNYTVKLYAHRGSNNGVTIRYGKNLTDITAETDHENLYNAVVPYWTNGAGTIVYGSIVSGNGGVIREETWTDERNVPMQDENGDTLTFNASLRQVGAMDLSGDFEEAPTVAQLESRAQTILNSNTPWIPKKNIKIDFIALWQTEEYKNIAALERVRLCDTVTVQYDELGVDVTAKVIKVVWDALAERYTEVEIGEAKTSFADTIMAETNEKLKEYPSKSFLEEAVDHATQQITGGLGGNVVIGRDGNGDPVELLIMDTKDKATAVNVWRWNLGGLGHSHNGYDGPFDDFAITQDGKINANFITVGHMKFNILEGGTLTLGGVNDGNGTLVLLDANGNVIVTMDNTGVVIDGALTANNATIKGTIRNEKGDEWFLIDESVATGGYGNSTDGLLDLSAQTGDGATISNDVALEAITGNLREKAQKDIEIESTTGDIYLDVANGKTINVGYAGTPYQIVDTSGDNNTEKIRHLYRITSQGTTYLGITNVSGSTLFAELTASDEKLKTNIEDAGDVGLKAINKIEHKSFDFIDGGYHRECGYIAQQLQDAIPYSTIAAPECDENGNQTGELLQIVDHEVLVYATKAIQELSAKVEELERRSQEV